MITQLPQLTLPLGLETLKVLSNFQTTSVDGQPLLNPFEFKQILPQKTAQFSSLNHTPRPAWLSTNKLDGLLKVQNINGKRPFETLSNEMNIKAYSFSENPEVIQKKAKVQNQKERTPSGISPLYKTQHSVINQNSKNMIPTRLLKTKIRKTKSLRKESKILFIFNDKVKEQVLFRVMNQLEGGKIELESLTREEILKKDPLLLVQFYEKHLKFSNSKDFDSRTMTLPQKSKIFSVFHIIFR